MRYKLSLAARSNLLEVYDYGLVMFGERMAERYQNELKSLFERLAEFPGIGTVHDQNIRRFSYWPYIILYSHDEADGLVIQSVLHGRQDWKDVGE